MDGIHKLTTTLARQFGTIVVQDLQVAGMVKNHRLARHIADASFGELPRQLEYKTTANGGRTVVADRWFPSSRTCSECGTVKTTLALSERTYVAAMCGLVLDRDLNAARNLAKLGEVMVAGSGPETVNGRGGQGVLALPVKRQPGTAQAGNTGTVPPRGGTALSRTHQSSLTCNGVCSLFASRWVRELAGHHRGSLGRMAVIDREVTRRRGRGSVRLTIGRHFS